MRDTWLEERAHRCLRTQYDDVSLCAMSARACPFHTDQFFSGTWAWLKLMCEHQVVTKKVWKPRRPEIEKPMFCHGIRFRSFRIVCFVIVLFRTDVQKKSFVQVSDSTVQNQ